MQAFRPPERSGNYSFRITAFKLAMELRSRLEEGSSKTNISGCIAAADAQAIFCFSPPERAKRFLSKRFAISRSALTCPMRRYISSRGTPVFSQTNKIGRFTTEHAVFLSGAFSAVQNRRAACSDNEPHVVGLFFSCGVHGITAEEILGEG